jgi:hypothetical protein
MNSGRKCRSNARQRNIVEKIRKTSDTRNFRASGAARGDARQATPVQRLATFMKPIRTVAILAIAAALASNGQGVRADFHLWFIKEIYSNYNGSVQFIELFTTSVGQQNLFPGHSISSTLNNYPFPADSPTPTNNRHLLLATPAYATLAADPLSGLATPNYTFPANNFFSVTGDTINFAGVDLNTFASIPTDGVMSLNYTSSISGSTVAANTPRNHAGTAMGSLNLPPPPPNNGDYNGDLTVNAADYTVYRNTLGMDVEQSSGADGNNNGMIDFGDYTFWKMHYGEVVGGAGAGQGALSTVPEPSTLVLILLAVGLLPIRFARRSERQKTPT